METQHWIEAALDCEYIDQNTNVQLIEECLEIGRMLGGMMEKSEMFCGDPKAIREEAAEYILTKMDHCLLMTAF